jgi:hypothetical protein
MINSQFLARVEFVFGRRPSPGGGREGKTEYLITRERRQGTYTIINFNRYSSSGANWWLIDAAPRFRRRTNDDAAAAAADPTLILLIIPVP